MKKKLTELYLGVDGGQSHTSAVIADRSGQILGRGQGGPGDHAEQPGGQERLRAAIIDSVGEAMRAAGTHFIDNPRFAAAHLAMTGGAEFKEETIRSLIRSEQLSIGHDAPAALAGALAGEPGIIVIGGTGSVAYGLTPSGRELRVGGWGYIFGDEGSGYWIAVQGVRRALLAEDGFTEPTTLSQLALDYFEQTDLMMLTTVVEAGMITRPRFASFALKVHEAAEAGDKAALRIVLEAGEALATFALIIAQRLELGPDELRIAPVGGVFRSRLVHRAFVATLAERLPNARLLAPRFDPAVGALLLAYRAAGLTITPELLAALAAEPATSVAPPPPPHEAEN